MDGWFWAWDGAGDPIPSLLGDHPTLRPRYLDYEAELWAPEVADPVVLELCRLRVASLLGDTTAATWRTGPALDAGLDEGRVAALARWTADARFDVAARAALALAEQFAIDPAAVTAADRRAVADVVGVGGLVGLVQAVAVFDGFARARLVLGVAGGGDGPVTRHDPAPPGPRPPAAAAPPADDPAAAFASAQPALFAAFERLYGTVWSAGVVDHPTKEVARIRNARTTGCRFCRNVRFDRARAEGLDEDTVGLVADGYQTSALSERHKAVVALTDVFLADPAGGVPAVVADRLLDAYGRVGALELVTALALFSGFSKIAVALGAFPEDFPVTVIPTPAAP